MPKAAYADHADFMRRPYIELHDGIEHRNAATEEQAGPVRVDTRWEVDRP